MIATCYKKAMNKRYIFSIVLFFLFAASSLTSKEITKFMFPLPEKYHKYVSSPQGLRDKIDINAGGLKTSGTWHQGIDIPCKEKTPVFAAKSGVIEECYPGYLNGAKFKGHPVYGSMIIMRHYDNTITLYAHLSRTDVREGDYVPCGQQIGLSGGNPKYRTAGLSTGSHLHFSIYLDMESMIFSDEELTVPEIDATE